jgi:hypothetical protein
MVWSDDEHDCAHDPAWGVAYATLYQEIIEL